MTRLYKYKIVFLFIMFLSIRTNAQWNKIAVIDDSRPAPSLFYKDGIIYAGSDNRIYISSDNGINWKESNIVSPDVDFISALIKHENKIFVGTYNFGVFYSNDEGITWNSLNNGFSGLGSESISDFAIRGSELYTGTYGGGIFVIDLNTLSQWIPFNNGLSFNSSYNINSLRNINGTLYTGAGGNSSYFKNKEGSNIWEEVKFGEMWGEPNSMYDIKINDKEYLIAASYGIYKSNDEKNWQYYNLGAGSINEASFATHNNKIYVNYTKGSGRTLWFTSVDNGNTWNFFEDQRGVDVLSTLVLDNKLFAGRLYGFNYLPLVPTSVDGDEMPAHFELSQNYPNPFNPATKINFTIPNVESRHASTLRNVTLKVYNVLGKEIATIVNDFFPAGSYSFSFNAAELNLTSGVYFYKLIVGELSSVKKMILMK
ncbi:MAG: T9SS type A sorting domain-containing protein [Ignavibacteria bacterium]|nr:T9SS type A sorting domain-containing protein [Ignavibacteria bacterium]